MTRERGRWLAVLGVCATAGLVVALCGRGGSRERPSVVPPAPSAVEHEPAVDRELAQDSTPSAAPEPSPTVRPWLSEGPFVQRPEPVHRLPTLELGPLDGLLVTVDPWLRGLTVFEVDLALTPQLTLTRARGDGHAESGLFGRGWLAECESSLRRHGDEDLVVSRLGGTRLFRRVAEGVWASTLGPHEALVQDPDDGSYTLLEPDRRALVFDAWGRLSAVSPGYRVEREPARVRLLGDDGQSLTLLLDEDGRVAEAQAGSRRRTYTYVEGVLVERGGQEPRRYTTSVEGIERIAWGELTLSVTREGGDLTALQVGAWEQTYRWGEHDGVDVTTPLGTTRHSPLDDGWQIEGPQHVDRLWFDERGELTAAQRDGAVIEPLGQGEGTIAGVLPSGLPLEGSYDEAGRLVALQGGGLQETYTYDEASRLVAYGAWDGTHHALEYDGGELSVRRGPEGVTRYERDGSGRLLGVLTPGGRRWSYERDDQGRVVVTDGPAGRQELDYDRRGRLTGRRDASGRGWTYLLDEHDRLEEVVTRDGAQRTVEHDQAGRFVATRLGQEEIRRSFDRQGRVASLVAGGVRLLYAYAGRQEALETPWGPLVRVRGPAGRLERLETSAGEFVFRHDEHGVAVGATYPNGVATRVEHDAVGNERRRVVVGASDLLVLETERGATHQIARVVRDGVATELARDHSGRLTGASSEEFDERYSYDADGNRVGLQRPNRRSRQRAAVGDATAPPVRGDRQTWRYDTKGRLAAQGADRVSHDPAGRLLAWKAADGKVEDAYDGSGRLAQVRRGERVVRYVYDPLGRPATRTVGRETTRLVYEGDQLLAEVGPGDRLRLFVHGPGQDQPLAYWEQGAWVYLHPDANGTVLAYSDAEGRLLDRASFTPFGEVLSAPADRPLFYAGRRIDREAGLINMRARWYAPALGRFLTPDPSGLAGGTNAYAYAGNRPASGRDPDGLFSLETALEGLWSGGVAAKHGLGDGLQRLKDGVSGLAVQAATGLANSTRGLRQAAARALERSSADDRRAWLNDVREGRLNPPDRTPGYESWVRNLVQPARDHLAKVVLDGKAGARSILSEVLLEGPQALQRKGPLAAYTQEVLARQARFAHLAQAVWQAEQAHAERLTQLLVDDGHSPGVATGVQVGALLLLEAGPTGSAYQAYEGIDLRAYIDEGEVRELTTHERVRSASFALLDGATLGTGLARRAELAKKAAELAKRAGGAVTNGVRRGVAQTRTTLAAAARRGSPARVGPGANPALPRAPPEGPGLVQALGGEAPGASRGAGPRGAAPGGEASGGRAATRPRHPRDPVRRLLDGSAGQDLPGVAGVDVTVPPTPLELAQLSERHGVEFALVYTHGAGRAGGGGVHTLISGLPTSVSIGPLGPGRVIKYHTHPSGAGWASTADQRAMLAAARAQSPQRTSYVIPANPKLPNFGQPARFGNLPRGPLSAAELADEARHLDGLADPGLADELLDAVPKPGRSVPRPPRSAPELGGFARPLTEAEILDIHRGLGGPGVREGMSVSSALAAAGHRSGFWNKLGGLIRSMTGTHVFDNANKRTTLAVVHELMRRNNVLPNISDEALEALVGRASADKAFDAERIAAALRGY